MLKKCKTDYNLKRLIGVLLLTIVFCQSIVAQCVNPTWDAAKHWSTYSVGELYSEAGKDYIVHTPAWCQSYSPSSANGHLGFSLHANPCDAGATAPVLSLTGSSNVTCSTADLTASISDIGGAAVTVRGFVYGTDETDVDNSTAGALVGASLKTENAGSFGTGAYTIGVAGLTSSMTYYVRAYATNATGTTYSSTTKSFFTCAVVPTLTTTAYSALSCETASSGGTISADGGDPVTARGVCWSTSTNPTVSDSKTTDGSGIGLFASAISGMSEGTTYYVRAYATNGIGTAYGNEISFTTASGCTPVYYSCAASNSWSLNTDCSTDDGTPGNTDNAVLRHDWFDNAQTYSLANLAWGQDGGDWFDAKPAKLTIASGGRAVFNTTSYTGLPGAFELVVDPGGIFASYTSLEVINSFENNGAVHLFGAVTNGNDITGIGDICYSGNFENSTLGGSMNGAFLSANEATLVADFFDTPNAVLGGNCGSLGGLLPVELLSFKGKHQGDFVQLSWVTASEINNDYFEVQASRDGENWEMISIQDGAGNSVVSTYYQDRDFSISFTDKKYYRLKQIDFDGKVRYSNVISVPIAVEEDYLNVYDNGEELVVDFYTAIDQQVSLTLIDMSGRQVVVLNNLEALAKTNKKIVINKENVLSGLYLVKVYRDGFSMSKKIVLH